MESIIKAEHISFSYVEDDNKSIPAVIDLSLQIEKGSITAILGRNGSGKSTLASLLCMIETPDEGKLYINGKDMTDESITEDDIYEARKSVGMVFQNPDNQLVATIVEEDVAFGPENLGVEPLEIRKRVDEALETVGMTEYARHATHRLSGGQKQRVAIAGVIAMKRDCIIFDESTAMLDPKGRQEVMDTVLKLNREEGITVILITHYMSEAALADSVVVMDKGRIVDKGTPSEVFSKVSQMKSLGLDVPQTTELLWNMKNAGYDVKIDIFNPTECAKELARVLR